MNKLKKILLYGFIILISWIILGFIYGIYNMIDKEIGKGYIISQGRDYIELSSKNFKNLILYGVIDYNYNEYNIILIKLKGSGYTCKNSNKLIFTKKIQYIIINKYSNKILSTENKDTFLKMKNKLKINLELDSYDNLKKIIKKVKESNFDKKILECKNVNTYPINHY